METIFEEGTENLPKSLRAWILANQDKVSAISYGGGYCTDARHDRAYDIALRPGYSTVDGMHTIIESTAARALSILRGVDTCHPECPQCFAPEES